MFLLQAHSFVQYSFGSCYLCACYLKFIAITFDIFCRNEQMKSYSVLSKIEIGAEESQT